ILAVEGGLPLRVAIDEPPLAAHAKVHLADRDRVAVAETPPPLPDVFGLRHRLDHELPRRVEQTRQADLVIRRRGDLETVAIHGGACDHDASPPSSSAGAVSTDPDDRTAVPRRGGSGRSTPPPLSAERPRSGSAATAPRGGARSSPPSPARAGAWRPPAGSCRTAPRARSPSIRPRSAGRGGRGGSGRRGRRTSRSIDPTP